MNIMSYKKSLFQLFPPCLATKNSIYYLIQKGLFQLLGSPGRLTHCWVGRSWRDRPFFKIARRRNRRNRPYLRLGERANRPFFKVASSYSLISQSTVRFLPGTVTPHAIPSPARLCPLCGPSRGT